MRRVVGGVLSVRGRTLSGPVTRRGGAPHRAVAGGDFELSGRSKAKCRCRRRSHRRVGRCPVPEGDFADEPRQGEGGHAKDGCGDGDDVHAAGDGEVHRLAGRRRIVPECLRRQPVRGDACAFAGAEPFDECALQTLGVEGAECGGARTGLDPERWKRDYIGPYVRQVVESGEYPLFARSVMESKAAHLPPSERFEHGLISVLDGIAVQITSDPAGRRAPHRP
ncbi:TetR/AcrR family transcriptional regulator C-terminal domain-containing protein [Sinosporangium siamense]|uniref:TetR/AcrR family transcriptional regulator C-terminal domain-containing protein n=1 Tax=Sinosporangium siamense TaxID=1367973 RepID=UPI0035A24C50